MRRAAAVMVLFVAATALIVAGAPSASACSCAGGSVSREAREADAVYVARPRRVDLLPGASFRVLRVLKGPPRSNLRPKVARGSSGSCGTYVQPTEYVLTQNELGLTALNLCTEHLRGPSAVSAAVTELGRGRPVPRRPDPLWLAQWLVYAGPVWLFLAWRRHRRAHPRAGDVSPDGR